MTDAQRRHFDVMLACTRLGVWDMDFLESMTARRSYGTMLTPKQQEHFDRIARKVGLGEVDAQGQ